MYTEKQTKHKLIREAKNKKNVTIEKKGRGGSVLREDVRAVTSGLLFYFGIVFYLVYNKYREASELWKKHQSFKTPRSY